MFLKLFWILFMCITSHKNHFQVVLLHKIPVFKVLKFLTTLTDQTCKFLCSKLFASVDRCLIDVQLIVNGKFSVFRFLADQSSCIICVWIHMHCIVFFIYLAFCNHISHRLLSHTTHIHFTKLGAQFDLEIDIFIFEFCTFLVYVIFLDL